MLSPLLLLYIVIGYFGLLMLISWITSEGSDNDSFFIGNRSGNWKLVAFGMIGSTLSGVTFVSVPGTVGTDGFQYLQITFGYIIGYVVVAYILLPIYYKCTLLPFILISKSEWAKVPINQERLSSSFLNWWVLRQGFI